VGTWASSLFTCPREGSTWARKGRVAVSLAAGCNRRGRALHGTDSERTHGRGGRENGVAEGQGESGLVYNTTGWSRGGVIDGQQHLRSSGEGSARARLEQVEPIASGADAQISARRTWEIVQSRLRVSQQASRWRLAALNMAPCLGREQAGRTADRATAARLPEQRQTRQGVRGLPRHGLLLPPRYLPHCILPSQRAWDLGGTSMGQWGGFRVAGGASSV
jgi:hypothetical protein